MAGETRSRRSAILMLTTWVIAPKLAHAVDRDPIETVTAIYRRAAAGKGSGGGNFLWQNEAARRTHFTARTAELWDRADRATARGDIGPIGFDPVTASQDPNLKSFEIKLEEDGPERARLSVALTGHGESRPYATIRYLLVREGGRWLVDDIVSSGGAAADSWSVRKLLQAHISAARRGS